MSDLHMTQLLKRIEEYHLDEKQRWKGMLAEDQEILHQAWKERDEANDLLRECWETLNPDSERYDAKKFYALGVKLGTRFKGEER